MPSNTDRIEPTENPPPKAIPGTPDKGGIGDNVPKHVGRVDSLTCYEVTEDELSQLEQGSPDSLMLNLAIALLSAAFSVIITFFNSTYNSEFSQLVFVVITVVAGIGGIVLVLLSRAFKKPRGNIVMRIRKRGGP